MICLRMQIPAQQMWLQNSHPGHLVRVHNFVLREVLFLPCYSDQFIIER